MNMFKEVTNIIGEREAYSIPFTKENLDNLHKKCKEGETGYIVAKENGMTISITGSYEQFRNGDFDTLFFYGCIPTKEERQRIDNNNMNISRFRQTAATKEATTIMEAIV